MNAGQEFAARSDVESDIKDHLPFLRQKVIDVDAKRVLELGTRDGNSTVAFLAGLDVTDGHLWAVDVSPAPFGHERLTFIQGDDTASETVDQIYAAGPFDIVFIDTSHAYEHTAKELALYGPLADLVLLHDADVETFGHLDNQPPYPVKKAVAEYADREGLSWYVRHGSYGLAVIW